MRNIKMIIAILIVTIYTVGCTKTSNNKDATSEVIKGTVTEEEGDTKLKIVTTLFPQYDFAKEIVKDKAEVILLLPPSVEAHSYEPTPQDIVNIQNSQVFIYTGENMEPWAHKIIESIDSEKLVIVDASQGITLIDEEEHEENGKEEHRHGEKDPHIWLSPINAEAMVQNIVEGVIKADPDNESFYRENAESYKTKLKELDEKFTQTFEKTEYNTIIYAGHFVFGYFAERYNLEHISPYSGFAPDAEPAPQKVLELIETIKNAGIKVIYYEELIEPKVAKIISDEADAEMMLLHGAHNVTKEELESGVSYISIMEENLEKLKYGLGYHE